jgi:hypothetical protein
MNRQRKTGIKNSRKTEIIAIEDFNKGFKDAMDFISKNVIPDIKYF